MNNVIKIRENNNPDFLNGESDPKRENKRRGKPYNKKNNNKNKKIRIAKLNKYYKNSLNLNFFNY